MISAYVKAVRQLGDPPLRRVLWQTVAWTAVVYVVLGVGMSSLVAGFDPATSFDFITTEWIKSPVVWIAGAVVGVVGFFAFLALFWLLFIAIVQFISGFYLETVIDAVETRHYAALPPATPMGLGETIVAALRFFAALIVCNLLALPFYLIPVFGLVLFYLINGYLLGREYFEIVALRRIDTPTARLLRGANRGRVLGAGLITTLLFLIPGVNLVAPVVAAAAMVHLFEGMPRQRAVQTADVTTIE